MADKVLVIQNKPGAKPTALDARLARHLVTKGRYDYVDEPTEGTPMSRKTKVVKRAPRGGQPGRVTKDEQPEPPVDSPDADQPASDDQPAAPVDEPVDVQGGDEATPVDAMTTGTPLVRPWEQGDDAEPTTKRRRSGK